MMQKKSGIYIKIFLLTLLLVAVVTVVNGKASCIISIEDVQIPEKSKTSGILMVSEVTNLGSFSINISWDPSIVNIDKISGSDFVIYPYINNYIGFVNITGFTIDQVNGDAVIADILFKAVGSSGSSCSLEITHCQLFTADPLPEVIDCSYTVNLTTITITEALPDNNNGNTNNIPTSNDNATDDDTVQVVIIQPNRPPTAPDVNGPHTVKQNIVFNYSAVSTDEDNDNIQFIFDWGDDTNITSDFVENGTVVTESHKWSMWGVYTIMVKAYDNMSESSTTDYVVLIDVIWVKDIGYLIDTDSDGVTYEKFYSNETKGQTDPTKLDNGSYMINSDADDDDDWIYDPQTDTLTSYAAPSESKEEGDNNLLYALILIMIIILVIIGAAVGRKPMPQKKSKSKEK